MRMYFAILAASLFAATSLASPVSAQSVPKPADQSQPSTRSDDDPDADASGQLDYFQRPLNLTNKQWQEMQYEQDVQDSIYRRFHSCMRDAAGDPAWEPTCRRRSQRHHK